MSEVSSPLDGKFEPEARDGCASRSEAAFTSIAISLKRIADTLEPLTITGGAAALDNLAWTLGQTFGRGFEIGSRKS